MACYTITITSNENIFLPKYKSALTDKIIADSIDIYRMTWEANNIRVRKQEDAEERFRLQMKAKSMCNDLLALIGLAKPMFHLKTKRIEHWARMIIETRETIVKWHEANVEQYSKQLRGL